MASGASLELAYPLHWPAGFPRLPSHRRQHAAFKLDGFGRARDDLLQELRRLGARYVVISSNIPTRLDGLPYAGQREPDDPAVAVYFDLKGAQRCIPCDRWRKAKDNVLAIARTVDAMRGIARWGTGEIVDRTFQGFAALPPAHTDWRSVFGLSGKPPLEDVRRRYRELALGAHPDHGGETAAMAKLNLAMQEAEKELT